MSSQPWPELTNFSLIHLSPRNIFVRTWGLWYPAGATTNGGCGFSRKLSPFHSDLCLPAHPRLHQCAVATTASHWCHSPRDLGTLNKVLSTAPCTGVPGSNDDPTQLGGITSTAVAAFQRSDWSSRGPHSHTVLCTFTGPWKESHPLPLTNVPSAKC